MTRARLSIVAGVAVLLIVGLGVFIGLSAGGAHSLRAVDIEITGSVMHPESPSARQGDQVTMTITADRKEEIHLHGYDIKFEIPAPGGQATHTFSADRSGSFEFEIEDSGTRLGEFIVNP